MSHVRARIDVRSQNLKLAVSEFYAASLAKLDDQLSFDKVPMQVDLQIENDLVSAVVVHIHSEDDKPAWVALMFRPPKGGWALIKATMGSIHPIISQCYIVSHDLQSTETINSLLPEVNLLH